MRVSTRINMGQYSICAVPFGSFVEDYSSGKIQIDSADQPYKDVGNNKTYSNIVSAFLKGIPLLLTTMIWLQKHQILLVR